MPGAEHRISRLVFEVSAVDQAALGMFRDHVRANYEAVIAPAIAAALDRVDHPGSVIHIDRLEITIGALDPSTLGGADLATRLSEGVFASVTVKADVSAPFPSVEANVDDLVHFLEEGVLPWSEPGRALRVLADSYLALDDGAWRALVATLRPVLVRKRAVTRLVRQFPVGLVRRLLLALLPADASRALMAMAPSQWIAGADSHAPAGEERLLSAAIERAVLGQPPIVAELLRLTLPIPFVDEAEDAPHRSTAAPATAARKEPRDAPTGDQPIPVHAAGLVLVHPFLSNLFERFGLLVTPGHFRDNEAADRAVLLTQFLATGTTETSEPDTVLSKLLCGVPLETPIARRLQLSAAEEAEAVSLLNGVVAHWHRLGNTSIAGLRESFLLRPGLLRQSGGRWRLVVESRSIDVLLNYLPWALSLVKTPFMKTPLIVEWR